MEYTSTNVLAFSMVSAMLASEVKKPDVFFYYEEGVKFETICITTTIKKGTTKKPPMAAQEKLPV